MEAKRRKLLVSTKPRLLKDVNNVKSEIVYTSSVLPIRGDRGLIFDVPPQKGFYIDTPRTKMHAEIRITKPDGSVLADTDMVCPQSACLYTIFKDLQVMINNHPIFYSRFLYPYYCNMLLNFKLGDKERTVVNSGCLRYDDNADLDPIITEETDETVKEGEDEPMVQQQPAKVTGYSGEDVLPEWDSRCARFGQSQTVELMGPVLFDLGMQSRVLRDDVGLKLIFTPNSPKSCLLTENIDQEYVVEITKAYLTVPRISVRPTAALPGGDINYFFVEHRLLAIPVAKGTTNFARAIGQGQLPRRLMFNQLEEESFNGDYHKSCFKFPHFNLLSCQATFAGERVPTDPLSMDFERGEYLSPYVALYENMKNSLSFSGLGLTREQFADNRFTVALDASKDKEAGAEHYTEGMTGQLSVSIQWKKPLETNIVILFIMEYERMCILNKHGQPDIVYAPVYNE